MLSTPYNFVRPLRATRREKSSRDPPRSPCRQDTPFRTPNYKPSPPPQPPTPKRKPEPSGPTTPLTPSQSKLNSQLKSLRGPMFLRNDVLDHPAGPDLLQYALNGCPVDCGSNWSYEKLLAAIRNGPHASANDDEAATACRKEAMNRVAEGCCRLVYWDDIKDNIPPNLKISPIAAILHKSRKFRMILDLLFKLLLNGKQLESVNEASNKSNSPQHAMFELGNVTPRIIWAMAMALSKDKATPFMFSKVDLKDGYWRMAVNVKDACNFAYVLPGGKQGDPVQLVIPDALQMGWSESPPFFCAATETTRDVIQADMDANSHVTEQPMEDIMMNIDWASIPKHNRPSNSGPDKKQF
jgi:hypothetical protein